ncbi:uncharacterized protein LOC129600653 isoform X2 [Paramacrobiotus metropolitanus]|uniref:uncharacterized protein LOC129600653 isoform X2 n=1 Tax=Paramacrobiotus metropolitanus TaxID=2943436 RepID=UPI002445A86E|nr:uncharacterized protein LOC129600653 isoform X2 [Paramacrobiotus metropolitanus]
MFARKVYHRNSVNVERDGTVQRGLIVDKTDQGWLIDFDVYKKDPELFPYSGQNIFLDDDAKPHTIRCATQCWHEEYDLADKMYVLLKLSLNTPWTWYKCIMLGDKCMQRHYGIAEVLVDGERSAHIVHEHRVRALYGDQPFGRSLKESDLSAERFPFLPGMVPGSNIDRNNAVSATDLTLYRLPVEILTTIFFSLNGLQQFAIRLVCVTWDSIILSKECTRSVIIDLTYSGRFYILASWFFHCITPKTKYLIFTAGNKLRSFGTDLDVLWRISSVKPLNIDTFILSGMKFMQGYDDEYWSELVSLKNLLNHIAPQNRGRIIFRKVSYQYLFLSLYCNRPRSEEKRVDPFQPYQDLVIEYDAVEIAGDTNFPLNVFETSAVKFSDPHHAGVLQDLMQWIRSPGLDRNSQGTEQMARLWESFWIMELA